MASHSNQQKKPQFPGGQSTSTSGPFRSLLRLSILLGLVCIVFEQTLCAQQLPLLKAAPEPGTSTSLTSTNNNSNHIFPVDNKIQRVASARGLPSILEAEPIREAVEIRMDEAEQKNNNPAPTKPLTTRGVDDKNAPRKRNDLPAASSFLPSLKPIGEIDINITAKPKANDSSVPPNVANNNQISTPVRDSTFAFDGAAVYGISAQRNLVPYQPLYFEEVNLERYGRAHCGQCVCSMLRFYGTVPMMPYLMTIHHPNETMYWNWPYEAGWGAPRVRELPPFSWKAATVQALAFTGAAAVIP